MRLNNIWYLFFGIISISLVGAANVHWVTNPSSCPAVNESEFPGQDCSPDNICGADTDGFAKCFDTSTITAPTTNTTTFTTNNIASEDNGGYIIDCFQDQDAAAPFCFDINSPTCDRNETFFGENRETICVGTASGGGFGITERGVCETAGTDSFNCFGDITCEASPTSDCNASTIPNTRYDTNTCFTNQTEIPLGYATCQCDPGYFQCDNGIDDGDGCEWQDDASCGSGTGTIAADQCVDTSNANCTSITNSDCNNDDSDSNLETCNGVDGCEITSGASCGNSTGTYEANQCSGATGNCTRSSDYLDCDDDDGDSNEQTCNGVNGCEVDPGSACVTGGLPGTVDNACPYNCAVSDVEYGTSGQEQKWSGSSPFLWFTQLGSGFIANLTGTNGDYWILDNNANVNQSGNITMGDRITFSLGAVLDNLVSGLLTITGSVLVSDNLNATGNITADNFCNEDGNCNDISDFVTSELDPVWDANFTNMQVDCPAGNYTYGVYDNGTLKCRADEQGSGGMVYTNLALTNNSETWDDGYNITMGDRGWFKGLFNWTISSIYLTFDGAILILNDTILNTNFNQTQMILDNNASWTSTYNETYNTLINNASYLSTHNSTYNTMLNQSCPAGTAVNGTFPNGTFICTSIGSAGNIFDQELNQSSNVSFKTLNVTGETNHFDDVIIWFD